MGVSIATHSVEKSSKERRERSKERREPVSGRLRCILL